MGQRPKNSRHGPNRHNPPKSRSHSISVSRGSAFLSFSVWESLIFEGRESMAVNLTANAILAIIGGDVNSKPLVQVLDLALVSSSTSNNNSQQQRYRMLLSDAVSSHQAMLATQLNDRVRNGRVKKGSVVQLLEYICTPLRDRKSLSLSLSHLIISFYIRVIYLCYCDI